MVVLSTITPIFGFLIGLLGSWITARYNLTLEKEKGQQALELEEKKEQHNLELEREKERREAADRDRVEQRDVATKIINLWIQYVSRGQDLYGSAAVVSLEAVFLKDKDARDACEELTVAAAQKNDVAFREAYNVAYNLVGAVARGE